MLATVSTDRATPSSTKVPGGTSLLVKNLIAFKTKGVSTKLGQIVLILMPSSL